MAILFILSTVLLAAACLIQLSIRGKWQTLEKIEFDTSAYDETPVRISGLLLRPRRRGPRRFPGLVFCPGLIANKEVYLGLCRRVASLGVAVLAIDLRGHGHSGGPSSFGRSEQHDVWAAIDVLGRRDDIDPDRLGVIGHSLGGITATRAGFEQGSDRIKTVVAMYCWKGFGDAVEAVFGPLDSFVGRWWPFFGWSRQFSVTDPNEVQERAVTARLGPEARVDYLLVVGSRDPLTDMARSKEIVARAAGRSDVEPGVTYGEREERTSRRIEIIKGANHFSVLSRRRTFSVIRHWLQDSLGVEETPAVPDSFASGALRLTRRAALILYPLSTLLFAGLLMGVPVQENGPPEMTSPCLSIPICTAVAFLLCSAPAIPWARCIRLKPFTPHWGPDIVSLIAVSRAILFLPVLALIVVWGRRSHGLAIESFGLSPPQVCAGLVAAGALFSWMVFSWNIVARTNRLSTLWPVVSIRNFARLFCLLLVSYLAEEVLFRGMIQSQLAWAGPALEVLLSTFLYSLAASAAVTVAVWPLFPSVSYAATFRSRPIVLLPVVFVFALGVFSLHGLAAALLYHFTGTVVASALFLALAVSFLFTGPFGIRTY